MSSPITANRRQVLQSGLGLGVGTKLRRCEDAEPELLDYARENQSNFFDVGDPWDSVVSNIDRFNHMRVPAEP